MILPELPVDPEIGGASSRMVRVGQVSVEILVFDRVTLGPAFARVQGVSVKTLECVEPDPGVGQHVIDLTWPDNNRLLRENGRDD